MVYRYVKNNWYGIC